MYLSIGVAAPLPPSEKCQIVDHKLQTTSYSNSIQKYQPGWLKIKGDLVNLRSKSSTKGEILQQLPLGTDVRVGFCVKEETIGEIQGCWYPIKEVLLNGKSTSFLESSAYLFSTALTDCYLLHDIDGDNVQESIFLAIPSFGKYQVRVLDSNQKNNVLWYSTEHQAFETDTSGGAISIQGKEITGNPLIKLELHGSEMCGSTSYEDFIYYDNKSLHLAIQTSVWSDSPMYHTTKIQWNQNKSLLFQTDATTFESSQKFCFTGNKYEACSKEIRKEKEGVEDF